MPFRPRWRVWRRQAGNVQPISSPAFQKVGRYTDPVTVRQLERDVRDARVEDFEGGDIERLLAELEGIPEEQRGAAFHCVAVSRVTGERDGVRSLQGWCLGDLTRGGRAVEFRNVRVPATSCAVEPTPSSKGQ